MCLDRIQISATEKALFPSNCDKIDKNEPVMPRGGNHNVTGKNQFGSVGKYFDSFLSTIGGRGKKRKSEIDAELTSGTSFSE